MKTTTRNLSPRSAFRIFLGVLATLTGLTSMAGTAFIDSFTDGPQSLSLGPGDSHASDSVTGLDPIQVIGGGRYLRMVADSDSAFRGLEAGSVSATISGSVPGSFSIQAAIPFNEQSSSFEPGVGLSYSDFSADWSAFDRIVIRFSTPPNSNVTVHVSVESAGNASWVDLPVPAGSQSTTILFSDLIGLNSTNVTYLYFEWSLTREVLLVLRDIQVTGPNAPEMPHLNLSCDTATTLSWPTNTAGFQLERSSDPATSFTIVTNEPLVLGTNYSVTLPMTQTVEFFRLHKP